MALSKGLEAIKLRKAQRAQQRAMQRRGRGSATGLEPMATIRCTEKGRNGALLIQERCSACHGLTVRDVIGTMASNGNRYSMADLRYDLKHGRLELLPAGADAGPLPKAKPRPDAPLAGKPLPEATLNEFFKFLQCQLRMELKTHTGEMLPLTDKAAEQMWPDVEKFASPNLGKTERWVPYHTILGPHELFLVEAVHSRRDWSEKQRFLAIFVFRAHCKRDLFRKVQLPLMLTKAFWQDPKRAFEPKGPMEKAMLKYRKDTGAPMITSCFRIIPPRVLKDDDENLVRSITDRTMRLLDIGEFCWAVMKEKGKKPVQKMQEMSKQIQEAMGLGETWAKMLTVCVDLAYPKEKLLESQCDVGMGAAPPLRALTKGKTFTDKVQALRALQVEFNRANGPHAKEFWATLKLQEAKIRSFFKKYPLVCSQASTKDRQLTASTLQVQLCEYRQFRHSIARLQYGLPDDESMRVEVEAKARLGPESFVEFNEKRQCATFEYPGETAKIPIDVPFKSVGGRKMVAFRIASMCFEKLRAGATKAQAEEFRDQVAKSFRAGEDAPEDSEAWEVCKTQLSHPSPLVAFYVEGKDGKKFPFQTTMGAAGGILEAERIARLCWLKFAKGWSKDQVIAFRNDLYKKRKLSEAAVPAPAAKKPRKGKA
eukprot:CAMPEP_0170236252 /NCGR_PEP_ID=MMETSP0116_2-20130129/17871_1 /TAXON_ID=400756 /ORGANISM="Durinskia baltica, Strain CSIRO CS-38" /LENGTH=652 /DNA_ID=CAMNT_0010487045 /DNA_START=84 /DNA_END=2042 /DNA_ORIENTATION=+